MLTLADVIEALQGIRPLPQLRKLPNAVVDSRHAIPGSMFIAIKGERTDGHNFIADAFRNGAHLALVDSVNPA
jgi:UDP-N-acetylmuramoyl-tripeptide--D-alanyl-D-alanine ligase